MKRSIKIFSILTALLTLCSLIASCGANEEKPTETESEIATEDTTVVEDPESFMLFANGKYTSAFVMRENPSSLDKSVSSALSKVLKEKTGVAPTFVNEAPEGKVVYVGDIGSGESEKINLTLRYGEAKVAIAEDNMYICFTNGESGNKVVNELKAAITTDSGVKVSREFASAVTLSSDPVTLPSYSGGNQQTIDIGDDSTMLYIANTALGEYEAYISALEADGFTLFGSKSTVEDNHFATFTKNSSYVYAYFLASEKQTRVVLGPIDMLPEAYESNTYDNKYEPSLTMIGQPEWMNCGQGFVFVLPDGRLIVQDGGMNYSKDGVKDIAYNAIKKVAPDPENIVIAAWFLSHPHDDHTDAFLEFVDNNHTEVKIESVVYGFGETESYSFIRGDGTIEVKDSAENVRNVLKELKKQGTKAIKAHTGQILNYGDVQIEVLFTVEDLLPGAYDYTNSTSLVIRLYFDSDSVLLLADTTHKSGAVLERVWGSYLESTMVQIAHHGMWASNASLYDTVKAEVLLWPNTKDGMKDWLSDTTVASALNPAKDVFLAESGLVTIKLPHKIENNKQAFVDYIKAE